MSYTTGYNTRVFPLLLLVACLALSLPAWATPQYAISGWGNNDYGQLVAPTGYQFIAVAAGLNHGLAIMTDGSLAAWGDNTRGQCNVPTGNNYIAVAAGGSHSVAIRSDHSLVAWGRNNRGQCNVPAGNDFVKIATTGGDHTVALRSDGTLAAWGWNTYGQCNVPSGAGYLDIAAGYRHSVAIKSDHSLVAWGTNTNNEGQLTVPTGNDFVAVAAGGYFSVALRSNGTLVAWGRNTTGQLNIPALTNIESFSAGNQHTLVLEEDGTVVAWGDTGSGRCNVPSNGYTGMAGGYDFSLALQADTNPPIVNLSTALTMLVIGDVWPMNNALVDVGFNYSVSDESDTSVVVTVTQNEPVTSTQGGDNYSPDVVFTYTNGVVTGLQLRAEQRSKTTPRVYLICVQATDAGGNISKRFCAVVAPTGPKQSELDAAIAAGEAAVTAGELTGQTLLYDSSTQVDGSKN